ncbi:hypothetical protein QMZ05_12545 [Bradyrhizobium sp. INPA03-11B]|uniref:hypothetical protein n=1 Tax=Bradyrhizobium sp. INPA03-11B TaxID=418598 RepID=UPI00338E6ED2
MTDQLVALPFLGLNPLPWQRPSLGTFSTWINRTPTALSTATATDNPNGLPLVIQAKEDAQSSYALTALLKPAPASTPWTITVAVAGVSNCAKGGVWFYPIVLRNSGTDKAVAFTWGSQPANLNQVAIAQVSHFTNVSTGQSATQELLTATADMGFPFSDYFAWFRIRNDGTNLVFSVSQEGVLFLDLPYSETLASFIGAVDQVGFGVERLNNPAASFTPDVAIPLWSWVEGP